MCCRYVRKKHEAWVRKETSRIHRKGTKFYDEKYDGHAVGLSKVQNERFLGQSNKLVTNTKTAVVTDVFLSGKVVVVVVVLFLKTSIVGTTLPSETCSGGCVLKQMHASVVICIIVIATV